MSEHRSKRIGHVTAYCHAGSTGGTERYILELIRHLAKGGFQSAIWWLQQEPSAEPVEAGGVRVLGLPTAPMRVDQPPAALAAAGEQLMQSEKPDVLHFHTFGLAEAWLAKQARQHKIPCVFTYHSPAWTCRRETLLLWGKAPCDGEVRAWRCAACQSEERLGCGRRAGYAAAAASLLAGWLALPLGRCSLRRRTAFFYDSWRYGRAVRLFLSSCDLVISCCHWSTPVLLRNGTRPGSLVECPQGVPQAVAEAILANPKPGPGGPPEPFTVGYLGRVTPVKGVHILMQGFSMLPDPAARLRIVGWEPGQEGGYGGQIEQLAKADKRIQLVRKTDLAGALAEYQHFTMLALPSVWLETGPLTLLEALALGLPVYGTRNLGQLPLLQERGRVVDPNTPEAWRMALENGLGLYQAGHWHEEVMQARGHSPIRTMQDVAGEMGVYYQRLAANEPPSGGPKPLVGAERAKQTGFTKPVISAD